MYIVSEWHSVSLRWLDVWFERVDIDVHWMCYEDDIAQCSGKQKANFSQFNCWVSVRLELCHLVSYCAKLEALKYPETLQGWMFFSPFLFLFDPFFVTAMTAMTQAWLDPPPGVRGSRFQASVHPQRNYTEARIVGCATHRLIGEIWLELARSMLNLWWIYMNNHDYTAELRMALMGLRIAVSEISGWYMLILRKMWKRLPGLTSAVLRLLGSLSTPVELLNDAAVSREEQKTKNGCGFCPSWIFVFGL